MKKNQVAVTRRRSPGLIIVIFSIIIQSAKKGKRTSLEFEAQK
jgi:hypothetical protein